MLDSPPPARPGPPISVAAAPLVLTVLLRLTGQRLLRTSSPLAFIPSIAPASLILAALAHARRARPIEIVTALTALASAAVIFPRTRRRPQPAPVGGRTVTMMSANVFKGAGDPEALVALIRAAAPDVLALQEQSPRYMRELEQAGIEELLPHRIVGDGGRMNDAGLLARHPLDWLPVRLPSELVGARMTFPDGGVVPVISAHPLPPVNAVAERGWSYVLRMLPSPEGALHGGLIAGDLNATLDHPQFRGVLARGWRDAGAQLGQGLRATWRGRLGILRLTIDHVLVPPGAEIVSYRAENLPGSDHRVLTVTVVLPPD